jgi:predicted DNA-binding protein YlxM (UPF0122 family)
MDKNIELVMLYEIYGKLLTEKQQAIFEEYYLYNLSLREIAENKKISYQAVRDSIKSSEAMLNSFENTVGMKSMVEKVEKALEFIEQEENIQNKKDELIKILK